MGIANFRKIKHLILLFCCTFYTLSAPFAHSTEKDLSSLTIITGNYPPGIDEKQADRGYISRLVADAYALEGIKVEFLFMPWARGLRTVRMGREVAIMYYAKNAERIKYFRFSDPIFEEEWLFFHLKSTKVEWETLADLSRYQIGATLSYSYSEEFHDLADKKILNVNWVARDNQNWQMLMAGRIDIFPSVITGWHQLRSIYTEETLKQVTTHPKPLKTQLNHILFSKDHPDAEYYREKFNQGFAKLKKLRQVSYYIPNSENKTWPEAEN